MAIAIRRFWAAWAEALRLGRSELLVEQLRLIYGGMTLSVLPMFPAIAVIVYVLHTPEISTRLWLWAAAAFATNAFSMLNARRCLAKGILASDAPRLAKTLMASLAAAGLVWGGLIAVVLDRSGELGNVLVLCVVSGILAGGMSLLSPILPAFFAFALPSIAAAVLGFLAQADERYFVFIVITLGYATALLGQAKLSADAAKAAIETKFQNTALIREAEAARAQAEEANQAKTKFLAAASHDLRQPIHAQGLFLDVLQRMPMPPQQAKLVAQVGAAREATAEMLNTLLDFSRVDAGVVQAKPVAFDAQTLLNKLEREFASQADAKGLAYRSRESELILHSDPSVVALIARNFIANAIRYTDRGGVLVTCRRRADAAELAVFDSGIGIAPEHLGVVFREFHQLGNPERDRQKGLGLGLAIADKLAIALGERITVKSRPGRGSVFKLSLALARLPREALAAAALAPIAAAPLPGTGLIGQRVLVVDDDQAVREAMTGLLQSWGCLCAMAENVAQAVEAAKRFDPQVIVTDFRLRESETGLAAVRAVRAALGHDTPAVLITGDTAPERLRDAMAGGIPLLHKPVSPQALQAAVQAAVQAEPA